MNESGTRYGEFGRFLIESFIARDRNTMYMVRDADWILDNEVKQGHSSPTVAMFARKEDAEEWCDLVEKGIEDSIPHEANFEGWPELKERVQEWMTRYKK